VYRLHGLGQKSYKALIDYVKKKGFDLAASICPPDAVTFYRNEAVSHIERVESEVKIEEAYSERQCKCACCAQELDSKYDYIREINVRDNKKGQTMFTLQYCKGCYFDLPLAGDWTKKQSSQ
jgi:hypothetical protein